MDKKTYYVAVDKNRTWRSIKSGTKNIAQTYLYTWRFTEEIYTGITKG